MCVRSSRLVVEYCPRRERRRELVARTDCVRQAWRLGSPGLDSAFGAQRLRGWICSRAFQLHQPDVTMQNASCSSPAVTSTAFDSTATNSESDEPRFLQREFFASDEEAYAHRADHAHGSPARMSWACLLKRLFDIDIECCPNCGPLADHCGHR